MPSPSSTFTDDERAAILLHGPWPPPMPPDPSNRVSGKPAAIALGRRLFFDTRLSKDGQRSCASCHDPAKAFADGRPRSIGIGAVVVDRNAIALANLRLNRWFGWDGAGDSLWAQSIRPILDAKELALTPEELRARVAADPCARRRLRAGLRHRCEQPMRRSRCWSTSPRRWRRSRRPSSPAAPRSTTSATRWSAAMRPPCSRYPLRRSAASRSSSAKGAAAPATSAPTSPTASSSTSACPTSPRRVASTPAASAASRRCSPSPFNLLGRYNDDPVRAPGLATRHVEPLHRNWGEFRVPSLRNVARTAPYMHDGSLATLADVVRHYSEVDEDRLHGLPGQSLIRPLRLTPQEQADLVAFLETL